MLGFTKIDGMIEELMVGAFMLNEAITPQKFIIEIVVKFLEAFISPTVQFPKKRCHRSRIPSNLYNRNATIRYR